MDKLYEFEKFREMLLYDTPEINFPYGKKKIIFADDTASGRPSLLIDEIIKNRVEPYYSNTHSNAYCGQKMNEMVSRSRKYIRKHFNLSREHITLFTGNGATGASNLLANSIDTEQYEIVNIYVSMFEHHSNYLPWYELSNRKKNINLKIIPLNDDELSNLNWLMDELNKTKNNCNIMNIITITGCSNVTGILAPIDKYIEIVKNINILHTKTTYLFVDFACLAPYKKIDMCEIDASFISGHKYLGGTYAPGLLIAHRDLFKKSVPWTPGGGCVIRVDKSHVVYEDNLEKRESSGTPNILGCIKYFYILKLKDMFIKRIEHNEKIIAKYVRTKFEKMMNDNKKLHVIFIDKENVERIPIISFAHDDLHFQFIVALLSDLFGIETRGGVSCTGLFSSYMNEKYNIGGWCRITFNWMMNKDTIDYILSSVYDVINNGEKYIKDYDYDKSQNIWTHK